MFFANQEGYSYSRVKVWKYKHNHTLNGQLPRPNKKDRPRINIAVLGKSM